MSDAVAFPTGTVTFVFTDIEGSSTLWEQHRAAARPLVDRHNELLRQSAALWNGAEVKTIGDAFFLAFAAPRDAVLFAIETQRLLQSEPWTLPPLPSPAGVGPVLGAVAEPFELRVRIGMHTGEAILVEHPDGARDYLGPAVNRAARVEAAAHGGQVLLSNATRELSRSELPPEISLRALGEFSLRGVGPEVLWQVEHEVLRRDFPPPAISRPGRHNLPPQQTALIGREAEVGAACVMLARPDVRLLTMLGPGGTGKTRLSLAVAWALNADFADGAWFVPLAPISDASRIAPGIALTLGIDDEASNSTRGPLEVLEKYLRTRCTLLLLDNLEHVAAAAPVVGDLLARCPQLKVLATSRVPLHLSGEHAFPVSPLALPDLSSHSSAPLGDSALQALAQSAAVQLFVERARRAKPDFALSPANARAVGEICARLDGLPLAIELAAARARVLSPEAMLLRLRSRLKLLTGGPQDSPERHQTLRAAIVWSHDSLSRDEKILFRRAAAFASDATLEALEAVCSSETVEGISQPEPLEELRIEVLDGIESLLDKSLLRRIEGEDGAARFGMLETIREFALERLAESGEEHRLHHRHALFFLHLAQRADRPFTEVDARVRMRWLQVLAREQEEMRAAIVWSLEHELEVACRLIGAWVSGRPSERGPLVEAALQQLAAMSPAPGRAEVPPSVHSDLLGLAAAYAGWRNDLEAQRARVHERLALIAQHTQEAGERPNEPRADDPGGSLNQEAWSFFLLAINHDIAGDLQTARGHFEQAERLFRRTATLPGVALTLCMLGSTLVELRLLDETARAYDESLRIFHEIGDRDGVAGVLSQQGDLLRRQGDRAGARSKFEQVTAIEHELGDDRGHPWRRLHEARLYLDEGALEQGAAIASRTLSLFCEADDSPGDGQVAVQNGIASCVVALSLAAAHQGRHERAVILCAAQGAHRKALGLAPPQGWDEYGPAIAASRRALGAEAFDEARATGAALSREQMIALAMED